MINLRPYQAELKAQIFNAWDNNYKSVLLRLPTGMGKTKSFVSLIIDTLQNQEISLPTAIMVHRKELVQQISLTLAEEGVQHNIIASRPTIKGIIAAQRKMFGRQFYNAHAPVTVISVDTLLARKDIYKIWVNQIRQVVIDEAAHVLKENKWGKAAALFNNARVLGVTATPERLDRKGLGSHADGIFDVMVEGPSTLWGIQNGYLSKYKIAIPDSDYQNFLGKSSDKSDYSKSAMMKASQQSQIVGDVVDNYIKHASGKQAILFATDITTAKKMEKQFNDRGIIAKELNGTTNDKERLDALVAFRDKRIQILINVDLFDEGLDVPGIECVIMARPTKSLGKLLQMCLDEKTEILTKRGWVKHDEMKLNDQCAAFNTENNEIEWCENENVFVRDRHDSEKMFTFNSPQTSIRITSQHDMISKSRHSQTWIKKTVDETTRRKDTYHVPVSGLLQTKGAKISEAELNFIGWFLSDGSRSKLKYTEVIKIYQCVNHPERIEHIRKTLKDCGFKFSEFRVKRTGELSKYADMIHFTIMKDKPIRKFKGWKNKRGWVNLSEWLNKDIPSIFDTLSEKQFKVMLNAYFLGDGSKKLNVDYKVQTMTVTCGDNKNMADRFQNLCVTRNLRCNLATEKRSHLNRKDLYMLHIKKVQHSSISGINVKDGSISGKKVYKRSRFIEELEYKKEKVWCVKNRLGTIVTRREGKVVILGNCGRGLRVHPDKDYMILIDHVGNILHHGLPCDPRQWTLDRIKKTGAKLNFLKVCGNYECNSPYDRALTECPWCGFVPPKPVAGEGGGKIPPEMVDGDLTLIDPDTLRELNQQVMLEDPGHMAKRISDAVNPEAGLQAMKRQRERIDMQTALSQEIAVWAGSMRTHYGYTDRSIHKKFYLLHEMTITEALGESRKDMEIMLDNLKGGFY